MTQVMYPGEDAEKWFDSVEEVHKDKTDFRLTIWRTAPSREDYPAKMLVRGSTDKGTSTDWGDIVEWIKENLSRGEEERYSLNLRLRNGHHVGQYQITLGADPIRRLAYERRILAAKAENQGLSDALAGKPPPQAPPQQQAPHMVGAPQPPQQPVYISNDPAVRELQAQFGEVKNFLGALATKLDLDGKIDARLQSIGQPAPQQQHAAPREEAPQVQPKPYIPPKGMLVVYDDEGQATLIPKSILQNPPSAAIVQHAEAQAKATAAAAVPPKGDAILYGQQPGGGTIEQQTDSVLRVIDRVEKIKEKLGVGQADVPEVPAPVQDTAIVRAGDLFMLRKEDGTADTSIMSTALLNPKLVKETAETVIGAAAEAFIKIQGSQIENKKKEMEAIREREEARKARAQADAAEADRELKKAQLAEAQARTRVMNAQAEEAAARARAYQAGQTFEEMTPAAEVASAAPEPAEETRQPNGTPVPSNPDVPASDASLYD